MGLLQVFHDRLYEALTWAETAVSSVNVYSFICTGGRKKNISAIFNDSSWNTEDVYCVTHETTVAWKMKKYNNITLDCCCCWFFLQHAGDAVTWIKNGTFMVCIDSFAQASHKADLSPGFPVPEREPAQASYSEWDSYADMSLTAVIHHFYRILSINRRFDIGLYSWGQRFTYRLKFDSNGIVHLSCFHVTISCVKSIRASTLFP